MKTTQYAEAFISFYYNGLTKRWEAMLSQAQYTSSNKQYRIAIPVPEELLAEELPAQDKIKVHDD